jgi:hypothetical protein
MPVDVRLDKRMARSRFNDQIEPMTLGNMRANGVRSPQKGHDNSRRRRPIVVSTGRVNLAPPVQCRKRLAFV